MIGIRREDKNEWERRAPLIPAQVAELRTRDHVTVRLQPSTLRAFPDEEYGRAGALLDEAMAGCAVVLGIKEIPPQKLEAGRAYAFFSHTMKGQPSNLPMLRRLIDLGSSLVDYEAIVDGEGRRLIFFGRHAGQAGMIDALWALGKRLDAEGLEQPFSEVRLAHEYADLQAALRHLDSIGRRIRREGLPAALRPLVCGFAGFGNVSKGAQEVLERLPVIRVEPEDLVAIDPRAERSRDSIYAVEFDLDDRYLREGGGRVELEELARDPGRFHNAMERWIPQLTLLVNGMFWQPGQARMLSLEFLRRLWSAPQPPRLRVVADLSCDVDGAIEATVRATTPGSPVYVYDLARECDVEGVEGRGPVILAVDNLPSQLPREASRDFGEALKGFVPALDRCAWGASFETLKLPEEIRRAVVVHRGALTPRFRYLERPLESV